MKGDEDDCDNPDSDEDNFNIDCDRNYFNKATMVMMLTVVSHEDDDDNH